MTCQLPQETQETLKAQKNAISASAGEEHMGDVAAETDVKAARAGSGQATMTELGSGGFFGAFDSSTFLAQLFA